MNRQKILKKRNYDILPKSKKEKKRKSKSNTKKKAKSKRKKLTASDIHIKVENQIASGLLNGTANVDNGMRNSDIPYIGPYMLSRIAKVLGPNCTMEDLVTYLVDENADAASVYTKLTLLLQNRQAGAIKTFENNPIVTNPKLGRTMVFDFNRNAYISIRHMLSKLSEMTPRARKSKAYTNKTNHLTPELIPVEYPEISDAGKYCLAHRTRSECQAVSEFCKPVELNVDNDDIEVICVPKDEKTEGTLPVACSSTALNNQGTVGPQKQLHSAVLKNKGFNGAKKCVERGIYVSGWRVAPNAHGMKIAAVAELPML